jgi:hypothetical protein
MFFRRTICAGCKCAGKFRIGKRTFVSQYFCSEKKHLHKQRNKKQTADAASKNDCISNANSLTPQGGVGA